MFLTQVKGLQPNDMKTYTTSISKYLLYLEIDARNNSSLVLHSITSWQRDQWEMYQRREHSDFNTVACAQSPCQAGWYWRIHQLFPSEPGSHTMGHAEQCHRGPEAPGLAERLGTGPTRHLEPFSCQETHIQRQQDRLMAQENTGVSDDWCQQSRMNETYEGEHFILHRNWLLRPSRVFKAPQQRRRSSHPQPTLRTFPFRDQYITISSYHFLYSDGFSHWDAS